MHNSEYDLISSEDLKNIYLTSALERIFLDKNSLGYWDESNNRIIEKLIHTTNWEWETGSGLGYRYASFCLGMILLAKEIYGLNTIKYDDKITRFLVTIKSNEENFSNSELTYGVLLSIILGEKIYKIKLVSDNTILLLKDNLKRLMYTTDNHDFLLLIAAFYFSQTYQAEDIKRLILEVQNRVLNSLNKKYYFDTGDLRGSYHQRIMYTLWGLITSSPVGNSEKIKSVAEKIITHFFENRRFSDNGFLWHPNLYLIRSKYGIKIPVCNPKSAKYLFECHQTFFANTINFYQRYFNTDLFRKEKIKALEWIWTSNRTSKNLIEITGLKVPVRIMDMDGNMLISGEKFKGSYEIGSYIFALSSFKNN